MARPAGRNGRGTGCVGTVMQTWEAITSRRNVRSFDDRPVPAADLDQILEAGRRSPSSQNWQPWDFILVTEAGQLRELAKAGPGAGHLAGAAAAIVVIGPARDNRFRRAQFDLGQAVWRSPWRPPTSASAAATPASPTCRWHVNCSASPRTGTGSCSSRSVTRRAGRWRRSVTPTGGRSRRSSTGAAGNRGLRAGLAWRAATVSRCGGARWPPWTGPARRRRSTGRGSTGRGCPPPARCSAPRARAAPAPSLWRRCSPTAG